MDGQEYLNQISASNRPMKPQRNVGSFFGSLYFKLGVGAVAILILIMIVGMVLSSKPSSEEKCISLKLRLDKTSEVISEYQPSVKSSMLRSLSASLKGIFTNTSSQLGTYMTGAYGYEDGKAKESLVEQADLDKDALMNEFFEAKINGFLDRTYAHKMTLEIYGVMSDEAGIINNGGDEDLKSLLTQSYDSLKNLYTQFNDFSETK